MAPLSAAGANRPDAGGCAASGNRCAGSPSQDSLCMRGRSGTPTRGRQLTGVKPTLPGKCRISPADPFRRFATRLRCGAAGAECSWASAMSGGWLACSPGVKSKACSPPGPCYRLRRNFATLRRHLTNKLQRHRQARQLKKPCRSNSASAAMIALRTSFLNVSGAITGQLLRLH